MEEKLRPIFFSIPCGIIYLKYWSKSLKSQWSAEIRHHRMLRNSFQWCIKFPRVKSNGRRRQKKAKQKVNVFRLEKIITFDFGLPRLQISPTMVFDPLSQKIDFFMCEIWELLASLKITSRLVSLCSFILFCKKSNFRRKFLPDLSGTTTAHLIFYILILKSIFQVHANVIFLLKLFISASPLFSAICLFGTGAKSTNLPKI